MCSIKTCQPTVYWLHISVWIEHSALSVRHACGSLSLLLLSALYPSPGFNCDDNAFQIPII